ncbi:hypothetical protein CBOM_03263 [Ceraceosorus bombacis]|uniref:Uncharacterized protein n=1 Tax=Ceraceosorus bombacis TaxID=401625 RepID=A0A0P1BL12_9BASI|nr:hypothetical protein CBOM_03263 [Ceraceosorus bombacis]
MASTAVVSGPPPGLGLSPVPQTLGKHASATSRATPVAQDVRERTVQPYSTTLLLSLSKSPLVTLPAGMPSLKEWYGDWEPYTPRSTHGSHGYPGGQNIGQGGGREGREHGHYARGERGDRADRGQRLDDGEFQSGSLEKGQISGFQGTRKGVERGFRRLNDESSDVPSPLRLSDLPRSRFPPSGKNPFGQLSAGGTFRPAGKDLDSPGADRRFGGSRRDGSSTTPLEERGSRGARAKEIRETDRSASGRDFGGLREKRRTPRSEAMNGAEDDGGEWESVPRSPETERRLRAAAQREADSASDWRRGGALAAPRSAGLNPPRSALGRDRRDERGVDSARKNAFPSWMAEDAEPSWMNDDESSSTPQSARLPSTGSTMPTSAPARKVSDNELPTIGSASGMDSIQAFRAQMKEKERLEKEKLDANAGSGANGARPAPPGLARPAAERSVFGTSRVTEDASDKPETSSAPVDAKKPSEDGETMASSGTTQRGAAEQTNTASLAAGPPGLPGRSSRFARFFDGKPRDPQAAALAAQQRFTEAKAVDMTSSAAPSVEPSNSASAGQSLSMADLFKSAGAPSSPATDYREEAASGKRDGQATAPVRPGQSNAPERSAVKQPSREDIASMEKIMALLSAGGGANRPEGDGPQNHARDQSSGGGGIAALLASGGRTQPDAPLDRSPRVPAHSGAQERPTTEHRVDGLSSSPAFAHLSGPTHSANSNSGPHQSQTDRHSAHNRIPLQREELSGHQQSPQFSFIQRAPGEPNDAYTQQHQQPHQRLASNQTPSGGPMMSPSLGGPPLPPGFPYSGVSPQQHRSDHMYGGLPSPGNGNSAAPPSGVGGPDGRFSFGVDPRMMGRPGSGGPMGPHSLPPGLPPHIAAALSAGAMGPRPPNMPGFPGNGAGGPGRPHMPPPPPPGLLGALPPHIQQHIMSLPPHVQHQVLSQHFGKGPAPGPGPMQSPMMPPHQGASSHHQHPGSFAGEGASGGPPVSTPPPFGHSPGSGHAMPSPGGQQPMNAANLMAMLGQRPSGGSA